MLIIVPPFRAPFVQKKNNEPTVHHLSQPPSRRRGRPPKILSQPPVPSKKSSSGAPIKAGPSSKKRKRVPSDDSSETFGSDDGSHSDRFPTFVSASALSSRTSSSSSSTDGNNDDLSHLGDTDSSIEAEEESFIQAEIRDRARIHRQLLGDDAPRKMNIHNSWVIPPRKTSDGPSDAEMDVDSDSEVTLDEVEEGDDDQEDEDEEPDGGAVGAGYIGFATGWSDDDQESNFDADLFFSNLSDDDTCRSCISCIVGDDETDNTPSTHSSLTTQEPSHRDKLSFEVTESWDGQLIFTNGLAEGEGILDIDFEAHAAQYRLSTPSSPSQHTEVGMISDPNEESGEGQGDTTDEELVGDDDLPNERAMRLLNQPVTISAIHPLSTMSPAISPGTVNRKLPFRMKLSLNPADIFSGRFVSDSDDCNELERVSTRSLSLSTSSIGRIPGPRTGHFEVIKHTKNAIIDDLHKDIPSPHQKLCPCSVPPSGLSTVLQRQLLLSSPVVAPNSTILQSLSDDTCMQSSESSAADVDLDELLEESFLVADTEKPTITSYDVDSLSKTKTTDSSALVAASVCTLRHNHEENCLTDNSTPGWCSHETPSKVENPDYRCMMKASPFSTMLWSNRNNKVKPKRSRKMNIVISPVLLPVRDNDRTPTSALPSSSSLHNHHQYHHYFYSPPNQNQNRDNYPHRNRKETRRERKLKRRTFVPAHQHQYHSRHHYPNSKARATSGMQRNNSAMGSVPPLYL